ncbi:UDP-N-acetylmuramate dehydrogenase [Saccharicrinis aurantiacus]|uniref:UDP-N-acetylmuramate dehydrogenase n=1 Tax=Saccharicrinis aurantiacus TaxID=1849719 RepID=UPI002491AF1D|nr:UDP-N-acetylmuramate dehydrogenase [Saccharicrinis aurantiacus]
MITNNISLKEYNTLNISVKTTYFAQPKTSQETIAVLKSDTARNNSIFILGGGSNILFKSDFDGLVIHPCISDINILEENEDTIKVKVGAGVEWDSFVEWAVNRNLYGIENLSLIPGNIGACPVQNIGAYGVEVKDVITSVQGIYLDSLESFSLSNTACKFDYRNSVFKQELKNKTLITSVCFELQKKGELNLKYGSIQKDVEALGERSLLNARKAIIAVRNSKLPDPKEFGNVGSFFKNPIIDIAIAKDIFKKYPSAPSYEVSESLVKIPAAWLIEQAGWKGKSIGNAAVHKNQALVLINSNGQATGTEILELAGAIVSDVEKKFGISMEKEVNVL